MYFVVVNFSVFCGGEFQCIAWNKGLEPDSRNLNPQYYYMKNEYNKLLQELL